VIGCLNGPELIGLKVQFRGKLIDVNIYAILLKMNRIGAF